MSSRIGLTPEERKMAEDIMSRPDFEQLIFGIGRTYARSHSSEEEQSLQVQKVKAFNAFLMSSGWNTGQCIGAVLAIAESYCLGFLIRTFQDSGIDEAVISRLLVTGSKRQ